METSFGSQTTGSGISAMVYPSYMTSSVAIAANAAIRTMEKKNDMTNRAAATAAVSSLDGLINDASMGRVRVPSSLLLLRSSDGKTPLFAMGDTVLCVLTSPNATTATNNGADSKSVGTSLPVKEGVTSSPSPASSVVSASVAPAARVFICTIWPSSLSIAGNGDTAASIVAPKTLLVRPSSSIAVPPIPIELDASIAFTMPVSVSSTASAPSLLPPSWLHRGVHDVTPLSLIRLHQLPRAPSKSYGITLSPTPDSRPPYPRELYDRDLLRHLLRRRCVITDAVIRLNDRCSVHVREALPRGEIVAIASTTPITIVLPSNSDDESTASSGASLLAELRSMDDMATTAAASGIAVSSLYDMVRLPLLYPRAFATLGISCPKGILLHGPPGVGKTWSVRTVCRIVGATLFVMEAQTLFGSVAGESEAKLRYMFQQAAASARHTPTLLFIDEIDVMCPPRSQSSSGDATSARVVAQLLTLMDGMDGDDTRGTLIVVAATNHANSIDAALRRPGRFDRELFMGVPDVAQRTAILRLYTKQMTLKHDVNLDVLATRCIGYVGADLEAVCREAAMIALHEYHLLQESPSVATIAAATTPIEDKKNNLGSGGSDKSSGDDAHVLGRVAMVHFEAALLKVGASSLRGTGLKDRSTSWDDIGGLEDVKLKLRRAVEWPMKYSATYTRLGLTAPRGILLYGPPGCAKTTLVKALATSASASFLHLDGAALYSSYVGESERAIRDLFSRARANLPCVVFFDEIDSIVGKRSMNTSGDAGSGGTGVAGRLLSTLLNEMDGMAASRQLMVVAATNRADRLDDALTRPGRFDQLLFVPPPDRTGRVQIMRVHTKNMPLHDDVNLDEIAGTLLCIYHSALNNLRYHMDMNVHTCHIGDLQWYTGAEIQNVCREAALIALRHDAAAAYVTRDHFERAKRITPHALSEATLQQYLMAGDRDVMLHFN